MKGIYLLLGSNLGDRLANLKRALNILSQNKIHVLDESSVYETEPWGDPDQQWFLNVVIQIETALKEEELLMCCLDAEQQMGRVRKGKWGSRVIDIDILYYNDSVITSKKLAIPHPGIPDRKFTLIPINELCPDEIHPILNQTQTELLANCKDTLDCRLTELQL